MSDSQKSYSYTNNHSFHPQIAADYDVPIALLVHHLHFWIDRNAKRGTNCYDGRTWMYDTIEEMAKHFPYWSLKQVERLLDKAVKKGVLRKGNHNKNKYDRTCWYAFENEEKFAISRNREMKIPKSGHLYQMLYQMLYQIPLLKKRWGKPPSPLLVLKKNLLQLKKKERLM